MGIEYAGGAVWVVSYFMCVLFFFVVDGSSTVLMSVYWVRCVESAWGMILSFFFRAQDMEWEAKTWDGRQRRDMGSKSYMEGEARLDRKYDTLLATTHRWREVARSVERSRHAVVFAESLASYVYNNGWRDGALFLPLGTSPSSIF